MAVHADGVWADLSLPATVPIRVLLPDIVDALALHGAGFPNGLPDASVRLSRPGPGPLDASKTLAQHRIADGTMLVVTRDAATDPAPACDDPAAAVAAAAARAPLLGRVASLLAASWLTGLAAVLQMRSVFAGAGYDGAATGFITCASGVAVLAATVAHRARHDAAAGLTLGLLATGLAGVAGALAVPGALGPPNAVLAAATAATVAVLAMRASGCGHRTLTAVSGFTALAAGAALTALLTDAPLATVGSVSALAALGLLQLSPRISVAVAGLSPPVPATDQPDPAPDRLGEKVIRGRAVLSSLVAASAGAVAVGAVCTVAGAHGSTGPSWAATAFATAAGVAVLLRIRSHTDPACAVVLGLSGTAALSAVVVATAWLGAAVCLVAAAVCGLGVLAAGPAVSLWSRRAGELAEYAALCAVVPLACWVCGLYGFARGLSLP